MLQNSLHELMNDFFLVSKKDEGYFPKCDLHRPVHAVFSSVMLVTMDVYDFISKVSELE